MKDKNEKKVQNQEEEILNKSALQNEAEELLGDSEAETVEGGEKVNNEDLSESCVICQSNLI